MRRLHSSLFEIIVNLLILRGIIDWTSIAMGAIDKPTGAKLSKLIFVADKGDYDENGDGLPQNQQ